MVNPRLWWSRPLLPCDSGERPNSPPIKTRVESSSPRRFRSVSSAAIGRSVCEAIRKWFSSMSSCASHCRLPVPPPETGQTKRTPFSTNRLAGGGGGAGDFRVGRLNRRQDRAIDEEDISQRLVVSAVYELPFGPGRRFLKDGVVTHVIGGWQ